MRHTFVAGNCLIISLGLALSHFAPAQNKELTADESIPIPKVEFDAQGELKMTASPNSSPNDFDFLAKTRSMADRSSSSFAGMRGTKTALCGGRPFHQITARRGNGISLTSRNGPGTDELRNVSDLTLQRFNALTTRSRKLSEFNSPLDESAVADA
jgi:hypothetical protein